VIAPSATVDYCLAFRVMCWRKLTCWRRLRDWTAAGGWPALHELLLAELRAAGKLDLDRCAVDGSHIRALKGGTTSAPPRSTAAAPAH
jgi:hypothetical protein